MHFKNLFLSYEYLNDYNISKIVILLKASAPTGLIAVSVTPYSVYLTWTAPAPANGGVSNYRMQFNWSSSSYSYYNEMYTGSNATAYNVTGLTACTTYSFAVSAYYFAGCEGLYSAALMNITTTTNSE